MRFYVLFSVDIYARRRVRLSDYLPDELNNWRCLDKEPHSECGLTVFRHRKFATENRDGSMRLLEKAEFIALVQRCDLRETCRTMGSLTHHGWMPAVSFTGIESTGQREWNDVLMNAYVTPFPEENDCWFNSGHGDIVKPSDWDEWVEDYLLDFPNCVDNV